eukprot:256775-Chlamydomonas_euryale.AAC.1
MGNSTRRALSRAASSRTSLARDDAMGDALSHSAADVLHRFLIDEDSADRPLPTHQNPEGESCTHVPRNVITPTASRMRL